MSTSRELLTAVYANAGARDWDKVETLLHPDFVLDFGFAATRHFSVGARYNYITYDADNTRFTFPEGGTDDSLNGSAISGFVRVSF